MKAIESFLNRLSSNIDSVSGADIYKVAIDISNVFTTAAKETFGLRKNITPDNSKRDKKWFNKDCRTARRKFHLYRRIHNRNKTVENKINLVTASKEYKNVMDKCIQKYRNDLSQKLKTIHSKNPKDYWKILNASSKDKKCAVDINDMYNFLKHVNEREFEETNRQDNHATSATDEVNAISDEFLNPMISENDIIEAVRKIKNGKSPGFDSILNEHISSTLSIFMPVYLKYFNIIYDSGYVPDEWLIGLVKPIYKKGDPTKPDNYRPITLLSCLGKVFTCILNNRLEAFANEINLIKENQAGFRKTYSTIDHILTLHFISNLLMQNKKKLFCAFVDFKQAFDTVWREGLWTKMQVCGISGKCFQYIQNMYKGIKSMIKMNGMSTNFFSCNVGVRQGENLSPFLFSLYVNDLEEFLLKKNVVGLQSITGTIENELLLYCKLLVLFYADDTVIMAESACELQHALHEFQIYCSQWKLTVNVEKTKILVFSKGPMLKTKFYYNNLVIENVKEFKYLGIVFSRTGSFSKAKKHLCEQAQKAMYGIIRKIRQFKLPVDCQFDLFDKVVAPILLYGSEVWGFENLDIVERIHLKFLKHVFNLKSSTPAYMVYGETGRFPLYISVYCRMITYWAKLFSCQENKIVYVLYKHLHKLHCDGILSNPWLDCIQKILNMSGVSNIWQEQRTNINVQGVTFVIKQTLQDQFKQKWSSDIDNSSKGKLYRIFKETFGFENYINRLSPKFRNTFLKFRTTNHRLPVEVGRWHGIPLNERLCSVCNSHQIADEFHYILECTALNDVRKFYLGKYYSNKPNVIKFKDVMSTQNEKLLRRLCMFILKIYDVVCPP